MPKISAQAIARHAQAAGFRGADLQTSVAVALAESGGDTDAHALTSREDSRGLWQINVRAHPELAANLYDPATNARAARAVLRKQGWSAWSVFPLKMALYMPTAGAAVLSLPGGLDTGDPLADKASGAIETGLELTGVKAAGQALSLVAKAGTWINDPRNWLRIAYIVLGGLLVLGALIMLAAPAVSNVVPVGKIARAVKG